jgi:hypothetical protein
VSAQSRTSARELLTGVSLRILGVAIEALDAAADSGRTGRFRSA